ncbi:PF08002 family protein [Formosa agariphila KMM 3901]|uniref:PF08002 family protein n=1 Tax=Formosa agariphila (strain DSM 15362 / KCTC 12365 / LMG 23005 / KMM 3901 / M-2Alg 35-1) TaxID=1347342 RepID=T2KQE9_FORAG|nr:DUF1697 domain-containing protein [Formosa agariphila]CDF80728.1 PF08002 family protein [Formosa agariphila KMM 3901]
MTTYIALLRGINVSGQKKVPMADLRTLMSDLGFENVKTYIQSGNVVFQSSEEHVLILENQISESILNVFGFEVPVLVKSQLQFQEIFDSNPFSEVQKSNSYFTLLAEIPKSDAVESVSKETVVNETFVITDSCVYFYSEHGYGKAKCNNNFFERKLKVSATTRNFKTMQKLLSLCSDL